ncbi:hypothetical protein [Hymenobacter jeollabukensis]|uniref:Uncharacterized protein n=1 Tax=Hymenobacter jeollabukensis TaxID=2025313 RepID=A0A5R8WPW9_9BACT|nr:hypothetical protein [Hymenobacter jeollabukensis]TLM92347.1 hypothetical protein FDY95_13005 [Hymenobacter jeollabukensis]
MNHSAPSQAVVPPLASAEPARVLALAQQVKDTVTIVCMNLMLLVPIAWPGLVLYGLRWRLTRRGARPSRVLWSLTLIHELLCFWLFADIKPDSDMAGMGLFAISYVLGTLLSIGALLTLMSLAAPAPAAYSTPPADAAD